jgi:tetratricopeptide (TPR) repeat protein
MSLTRIFVMACLLCCSSSLIAQFPMDEADKYILQGDNMFKLGNFEEALNLYSNAINVAPDYAKGYMKRAYLHRVQGSERLAEQDYEQAMRLNPFTEYIYDRRAVLSLLATDFIQLPKAEGQGVVIDESTCLLFNGDISSHTAINIYYDLVSKSNSAYGDFTKEGMAKLALGLDLLVLGDYDQALTFFFGLKKELNNHYLLYDLLGLTLAGLKEWESALEYFGLSLDFNPEYVLAYYNRAMIQRILARNELALDDLYMAILLDQEDSFLYFARAVVQKEMGDFEAALSDYDMALLLDGNFQQAYIHKSEARKIKGDLSEALMDINMAIELDAANPMVWNLRGNIRVLFKDYEAAIQDYSHAIELDNRYAKAYYNRGITQIMRTKKREGCDDLLRAEAMGYVPSLEKIKYFCRN